MVGSLKLYALLTVALLTATTLTYAVVTYYGGGPETTASAAPQEGPEVPGVLDVGPDPVPARVALEDSCTLSSLPRPLERDGGVSAGLDSPAAQVDDETMHLGYATSSDRVFVIWRPGAEHVLHRVERAPSGTADWSVVGTSAIASSGREFQIILDNTDPRYSDLTSQLLADVGANGFRGVDPDGTARTSPGPATPEELLAHFRSDMQDAVARAPTAYPLAVALGFGFVDRVDSGVFDYRVLRKVGEGAWEPVGGDGGVIQGVAAGQPTPVKTPANLQCVDLRPGGSKSVVASRSGSLSHAMDNGAYDRLVLLVVDEGTPDDGDGTWEAGEMRPYHRNAWVTGYDLHRLLVSGGGVEHVNDDPFWPKAPAHPDATWTERHEAIFHHVSDQPPEAGMYMYWVSARDLLGQVPAGPGPEPHRFSQPVLVAARDLAAPPPPTITGVDIGKQQTSITWAPGDEPADDIAGYHVIRGLSPRGRLPLDCDGQGTHGCFEHVSWEEGADDLRMEDETPPVGQEQWYAIQAVDKAGNRGLYTAPVRIVLEDTEGPSAPSTSTACDPAWASRPSNVPETAIVDLMVDHQAEPVTRKQASPTVFVPDAVVDGVTYGSKSIHMGAGVAGMDAAAQAGAEQSQVGVAAMKPSCVSTTHHDPDTDHYEAYCAFAGDVQDPTLVASFPPGETIDLSDAVGRMGATSALCWFVGVDAVGNHGDVFGKDVYKFNIDVAPPAPAITNLTHSVKRTVLSDRVQRDVTVHVEWAAKESQFTSAFYIVRADMTITKEDPLPLKMVQFGAGSAARWVTVQPPLDPPRTYDSVSSSQSTTPVGATGFSLESITQTVPPDTVIKARPDELVLWNPEAILDGKGKYPIKTFHVPPDARAFDDMTAQEGHVYEYTVVLILAEGVGVLPSEWRPIKILPPFERPVEDLPWRDGGFARIDGAEPRLRLQWEPDCTYCYRTIVWRPEAALQVDASPGKQLTYYHDEPPGTRPDEGFTIIEGVDTSPISLDARVWGQTIRPLAKGDMPIARDIVDGRIEVAPAIAPGNNLRQHGEMQMQYGAGHAGLATTKIGVFQVYMRSSDHDAGWFAASPIFTEQAASAHVEVAAPADPYAEYVVVQFHPLTMEPVAATPPAMQPTGPGWPVVASAREIPFVGTMWTSTPTGACDPSGVEERQTVRFGDFDVEIQQFTDDDLDSRYDGVGTFVWPGPSGPQTYTVDFRDTWFDGDGDACQGMATVRTPVQVAFGDGTAWLEDVRLLPAGQPGGTPTGRADLRLPVDAGIRGAPSPGGHMQQGMDPAPITIAMRDLRVHSDGTFSGMGTLGHHDGGQDPDDACGRGSFSFVLHNLPMRVGLHGSISVSQAGAKVQSACLAYHTPFTAGRDPGSVTGADFRASDVVLTAHGLQGTFVAQRDADWRLQRPFGLALQVPSASTVVMEHSRIAGGEILEGSLAMFYNRANLGEDAFADLTTSRSLPTVSHAFSATPREDDLWSTRVSAEHHGLVLEKDGRIYQPGLKLDKQVEWLQPYGFRLEATEGWELYIPPLTLPMGPTGLPVLPKDGLQAPYDKLFARGGDARDPLDDNFTLDAGLNLLAGPDDPTRLYWDNCGDALYEFPIQSDLYLRAGGISDGFGGLMNVNDYAQTKIFGYDAALWQFAANFKDNLFDDSAVLMDIAVPWPADFSLGMDGMSVDSQGCLSQGAVRGGSHEITLPYWDVTILAQSVDFRSVKETEADREAPPSEDAPPELAGPGLVRTGVISADQLYLGGRSGPIEYESNTCKIDRSRDLDDALGGSGGRPSCGTQLTDKSVTIETDGILQPGIATDPQKLWVLGDVDVPHLENLHGGSAALGIEVAFQPNGDFYQSRMVTQPQQPEADVVPLYRFDGYPFLVHGVQLMPWKDEQGVHQMPAWNTGATPDAKPGKMHCGTQWGKESDVLLDYWMCQGAVVLEGFPVAPALGPLGRSDARHQPASFYAFSGLPNVGLDSTLGASRAWSQSEHIEIQVDFDSVVFSRDAEGNARFVGYEPMQEVRGEETIMRTDIGMVLSADAPELYYGKAAPLAAFRAVTVSGVDGGALLDPGGSIDLGDLEDEVRQVWAGVDAGGTLKDHGAAVEIAESWNPAGYEGVEMGPRLKEQGVYFDDLAGQAKWNDRGLGQWQPVSLEGTQQLRLEPGEGNDLLGVEDAQVDLLPQGKLRITGTGTANVFGQEREIKVEFQIHPTSEDWEGAFSIEGPFELGIVSIGEVAGVMGAGEDYTYMGFKFQGTVRMGYAGTIGGEALLGRIPTNSEVIKKQFPSAMDTLGKDMKNVEAVSGFYLSARGGFDLINAGCAATVGVSVRVAFWYWSTGSADTYGGLMGGSVHAQALCLVSGKGDISVVIKNVGGSYSMEGEAWIAAGVGDCSPGDWTGGWHKRWWDDSWCAQAGAAISLRWHEGQGWDWDIDYDLEDPL